MRKRWPATAVFWCLAGGVLAADLLTKWLVYDRQLTSREVQILPGVFFCLEPAANLGIAWGLLAKWPQFIAVARAVAAVAVIVYFHKYSRRGVLETLALGGILGGAIGNLFDGMFLGYVRDFLAFQIAGYRWPNFNVADSFISTGAVILIGYMLIEGRSGTHRPVEPAGNDERPGKRGE